MEIGACCCLLIAFACFWTATAHIILFTHHPFRIQFLSFHFIICIISCTAVVAGTIATAHGHGSMNCGRGGSCCVRQSFGRPAYFLLTKCEVAAVVEAVVVPLEKSSRRPNCCPPHHCCNSNCGETAKSFCGVPSCVYEYQSRVCYGIRGWKTFDCRRLEC